MRLVAAFCAALLWLDSPAAQAATVTLNARIAGERPDEVLPATALVTLTPEPGTGQKAVEVNVPVPGHVQVELSAASKWILEARSDRLWTRARTIAPAETDAYTLDFLPAGVIAGRLRDETGPLPQAELTVGFAPAGQPFPMAPETSRCATDAAGGFRCTLPLGRYDLRFKTPQRVPFYRWAHDVAATSDAGEVRVSRGGTISGYVAPADLPASPEELRIVVEPSGQVQRGPHGFFSTRALPPGVYDLTVEVPGRGVASLAAIQVRDGLEARLPRPVTLEPRVPVTVRIAPPQPPSGPSWQLELMRAGPEGLRPATRGQASKEGTFVAENLTSGQYQVIVRDDRGSRWAAQPLHVLPATREFTVELPVVYAEGTLRRGSEPLEGTIWFGGQFGTPGIAFETDAQGRFAGMLPRAGEWTVDVIVPPAEDALGAIAEVTLDEETNIARADVTLPDNRVEGMVVDTSGAAVPRADVTFSRGPHRLAFAVTDAEGRFVVRGLTAGRADVAASASGARSPLLPVAVSDGPNPPLRLVVHRIEPLKSRVVGPAGPVPGARVAIWPDGGGQVSMAVTDSEGYFTTMGHPPGQRLLIAAYSPGLALHLGTLPASAPQAPQVTLTSGSGVLEIAAGARVAYVEYGQTPIPIHLALRLLAPAASADPELRTIRLAEVPPGQYRACSQEAAGTPVCASGWLAPGGTLQLKLGAP